MNKMSLLLTASRFGASYFLDIHGKMRPQDVQLGEVWQPTDETLATVAGFTGEDAEVIGQLVQDDPAGAWRRLVAAADRSGRHCIARVYYYHLPAASDLWGAAAGSGRVIHLIRRNLFESYLSREIAQKAGLWQGRHGAGAVGLLDLQVRLDPVAAKRHIDARRRDIEWARARFQGCDYHEIAFEDINRAPGACAEAINQIFHDDPGPQVHPGTVRSGLARVKRRSNADTVENYADVAHLDKPWV